MSSSYDVLCLSHTPALSTCDPWANDPDQSLAKARREHPACDLVVARYSGALVELGCPPGGNCPRVWHHHNINWTDVDWLRLAHAAHTLTDKPAGIVAAINRAEWHCWTTDRLDRLGPTLED